jgi:hypothetical protein
MAKCFSCVTVRYEQMHMAEHVGNRMFRKTNLAAAPLYRTVAGEVSGLVAPVTDCPVIPVGLDDVV